MSLIAYPDPQEEKTTDEVGIEYQDFVVKVLYEKMGIPLVNYHSKKFQYEEGENRNGIEIKLDRLMCATGNIFIEIQEKRRAEQDVWVNSGIWRKDNSWLYLIGDYNEIFIFGKKHLRIQQAIGGFEMKKTPTSKGFLIPVIHARDIAVHTLKCVGGMK